MINKDPNIPAGYALSFFEEAEKLNMPFSKIMEKGSYCGFLIERYDPYKFTFPPVTHKSEPIFFTLIPHRELYLDNQSIREIQWGYAESIDDAIYWIDKIYAEDRLIQDVSIQMEIKKQKLILKSHINNF